MRIKQNNICKSPGTKFGTSRSWFPSCKTDYPGDGNSYLEKIKV